MTATLLLLGDSLADSGNTAALARLVGEEPFAASRYDRGGNVKASDGPVLAEQIARRLGARLASTELLNLLSLGLRGLAGGPDPQAQLWNYAYAGATSGRFGSRRAGLGDLRLGLRSQVGAVLESVPPRADLDALVIAGSNDILDRVAPPRRLRRRLASASSLDDRRFLQRLSRRIATNLGSSIDRLTGQGIDEVLVVGLGPLARTPLLRRLAGELSPPLGRRLRRLVNQTARSVNRRLERRFNADGSGPAGRGDGVLVIDGFEAWRSVARPRFLDDVHPTARTSGRLADAVVARLGASSDLSSYGFGG